MLKNNKIIAILIVLMIILTNISSMVMAIPTNPTLEIIQEAEYHLQYDPGGGLVYITMSYIGYYENGNVYPAYCLNRDLSGIDKNGSYSVDIQGILEDENVWRVIINGFPYKTPSDLGVENELDAYCATKQAVFCVIDDLDPYTHYTAATQRGEKIHQAIINLVDIGKNGTQTREEPNLQIKENGSLIDEGEYLSQVFTVVSAVNISSYTINSDNIMQNAYISDMNNNSKNNFNQGESFKVRVKKNSLSTDISINLTAEAYCETYPIYYGKSPNETLQNYAVTYDKYTLENAVAKLNLEALTGELKVIKVDKDDNEIALSNVEFEVYDANGEYIQTIITDENGIAKVSDLIIGEYILKETKTNEIYELNQDEYKFNIVHNQTTLIEVENEKKKGNIQVIKVDIDDNEVLLEGVIFDVIDNLGNIVDTITTNDTGTAISKDLPLGQYTIKEIKTQDYYILNEELFTVVVNKNETSQIIVENESVKLDVEITKTGFIETQSSDNIYYEFTNIKNNSNVSLDNFTWSDILPTDFLRVDKLYTGTWSEELEFEVWYKTNLNEFKLFKENLSSVINNEIDFKQAVLEDYEFITEFEIRFGTVESGFREIEAPIVYCDLLEGLGNGLVFENITNVSGNYLDKYVEAQDNWKTITYFKTLNVMSVLPKTG